MKKLIITLLCVFATCLTAVSYDGIHNGIMVIGSKDKDFDLKTVDGINGTINYNVELYTDGTAKQYCLRFAFDESKHFFMIPTYATILLKTKTGDVIELHALYAYDDPISDKTGYAYFPISEEQLEKISKEWVIRFRIQTIVGTDHHSTFAEKEWKVDQLAWDIEKMVSAVNKEWDKKKQKYLSSQKGFRSDF